MNAAHKNTSPSVPSGLLIGTRGWQYPQWIGQFYPDDLPEEWQLGYYSNELNTVLLSEKMLLDATPARIANWQEDTGEQFRFFIEVTTQSRWKNCLEQAKPIREHVAGFVLHFDDAPSESMLEPTTALTEIAPVYLDARLARELADQLPNDLLEMLGDVVQINDSHVLEDIQINTKKANMLFLAKQVTDATPKQLRLILETCHRAARHAVHAALFFVGDPPNIAAAQQAIRIQELML